MSTLEVTATGAAADAVTTHVPTLVQDRVASRIFAKDHTLWGPAAEEESAKRLNWTGLPRTSRHLIGEVAALRDELSQAGYDRVVLCGMGGSSLAPEVICATAGVPIDVLDSSDPDVVRAALTDLDRTVVVVSSKSGSTVETDSQRRAFEQAFRDAGLDPTARMVIVTDPGSPLDADARAAGFRVVNADPQVGGRYSALTAFGLVPSALAGADVETLLDDAEAVSDLLAADDDANPALRLAAAMAGTQPLRDKLVLVDDGTENVGFGAWAEQLIAESTGKDGTGILPVVAIGAAPATLYDDGTVVRLVATGLRLRRRPGHRGCRGDGVVGRLARHRGRPPRRPDHALGDRDGRGRAAARHQPLRPARRRERQGGRPRAARRRHRRRCRAGLHRRCGRGHARSVATGSGTPTVDAAVDTLLGLLDDQQGYIAVMAYLDRLGDADLELVARDLFDRTGRPATFGWGPRFLHSTGQYHKGGPGDRGLPPGDDRPDAGPRGARARVHLR
jgi:glucose-6-phosphate isomerase